MNNILKNLLYGKGKWLIIIPLIIVILFSVIFAIKPSDKKIAQQNFNLSFILSEKLESHNDFDFWVISENENSIYTLTIKKGNKTIGKRGTLQELINFIDKELK